MSTTSTRSRTVVLAAVSLAGAAAAALAALELSRRRARARRAARGPARVVELRIHPVKSAGACLVDRAEVTRFGLRHDRAFAIVDEQSNEIQTQRKTAKMAILKPKLTEKELILTAPGMSELAVPLHSDKLEQCTARKIGSVELDLVCWKYGAEVSEWLNRALDRTSLHLVRVEPSHAVPSTHPNSDQAGPRLLREQLAGEAAGANDACAIHDWAPFLLANAESLADLNSRLGRKKAVGIDRFRANVVFEGGDLRPYEEDRWTVVTAGAARFRCLESCVRCTVPSIDQETGTRPDGQNPTALLRSYRTQSEDACGPYAKFGPVFGAWAVPDFVGQDEANGSVVLRVGDLLTVEGTAAVSSYDHWARKHPEARPGR